MHKELTIDQSGIYTSSIRTDLSYPDEGNEYCFGVEENSLWFKQRNELIIELLKKHKIAGDFLDIGGGNGFQARAIADSGLSHKVILCEPGYQGCLNAKKRGIADVYNMTFEEFPFHQFNIAGCGLFDVIEHIEDDITFLNKLYELLPSGTKVYINVPALKTLWSDTDIHSGHFRRYNSKDISRIQKETPFKVIDHGFYFNFYILPLFLLRVIPYRLGFRKNKIEILRKEQKLHQPQQNFFDTTITKIHTHYLKRIKYGRYAGCGTSLFIVLEAHH